MRLLSALSAMIFLASAGHLAVSALDHPLRPIPEGTDPVYLLIPALLLGFCGVVFTSFVFGASWQDVADAVRSVMTNMFAIV